MFAKVIDVDDKQIYLEIDRQLRFRARYILRSSNIGIQKMSRVDFDFLPGSGNSCIVIRSIKSPSSQFAGA